jgi:hypothetical protein
MSGIYSRSYITLATTKASNNTEGFYQEIHTRNRLHTRSVPDFNEIGETCKLSLEESRDRWNDEFLAGKQLLLTRAWVFQERLLSPRIVHFAHGMLYWECFDSRACETGSDLSIDCSVDKTTLLTPKEDGLPRVNKYSKMFKKHQATRKWTDLVAQYTRCKLTYEKDRLPALQGERQCEYHAGLWADSMFSDLMWQTASENELKSHHGHGAPAGPGHQSGQTFHGSASVPYQMYGVIIRLPLHQWKYTLLVLTLWGKS